MLSFKFERGIRERGRGEVEAKRKLHGNYPDSNARTGILGLFFTCGVSNGGIGADNKGSSSSSLCQSSNGQVKHLKTSTKGLLAMRKLMVRSDMASKAI